MIGVSFGELMIVCVGLGIGFVSLWWALAVRRVHKVETQKHAGVITCRICSVRYEPSTDEVSICPACGTPNELQPPGVI